MDNFRLLVWLYFNNELVPFGKYATLTAKVVWAYTNYGTVLKSELCQLYDWRDITKNQGS